MARNEDDLRDRLQRAALELFRERGFDRTTAAAIAARAGVTERTFFRQFPDKREVIFDGEAVLRDALTGAIAGAPLGLSPLDSLFHAFRTVVPLLEANRHVAMSRQEVISTASALAERELAKHAALAEAMAQALKARGTDGLRADLAARTGMAAFAQATLAWLDDPSLALGDRLDLSRRALLTLFDEGHA